MRGRLAPAALLAALLLAGCVQSAPDPSVAVGEPGAVDLHARVLGVPTSEPALVEHPSGALFVAGFRGDGGREAVRPLLYRSDDGGATFSIVDQGDVVAGAVGNSDTDLALAPDGTLYHAAMEWMPWGHAITMGVSEDAGATWRWSVVAAGPFVDRPWVEVGPDGVAHVTWSSPLGLHHATSDDHGRTWQEGPRIHPTGGSGGLAVGPAGELAVRVFPLRAPAFLGATFAFLLVDEDADGVAVSTDGGATWTMRELPGTRAYVDEMGRGGDGTPRWADPVAFDASGALHAAWAEGPAIQLATSRDLGATWETRALPAKGEDVAYYPYLRAGAPGELVATWFTSLDAPVAHVACVLLAGEAPPSIAQRAFEVETDGGTRGEYFQGALLADGRVAAAFPIDGADFASSGFAFVAFRP